MRNPYSLTAFLALVFGAVAAYLYFIDLPTVTRERQQTIQQHRIIPFDDREVIQLTLSKETESLTMTRDNRWRWTITDPITTPADGREVGKILRALTIGTIQRVIQEQGQNPERYGLSPPHLTVTLNTDNQSATLALGDRGPFMSSMYVRNTSDNQIVLTTLDPLTFANKSLYTFRFKKILSFDRTAAQKLVLQLPQETLVLIRTPGVHRLTPNWRFESPIQAPADNTQVGLLLMAFQDLTAEEFVDSETEKRSLLHSLGLPQVFTTIETKQRTHQVTLYQADAQSPAYAMTTLEQPLYRINSQVIREVTKGHFDIRDRRLLGMEAKDVAILRVNALGQTYALINQNDEWVLEKQPHAVLKQEVVKLFVSRVTDLPAEIRISEKTKSLSPFELDHPVAEFTATNWKGQDRGQLALGKRERGLIYARGAGLPGIYQVRSNILTQIPTVEQLLADR